MTFLCPPRSHIEYLLPILFQRRETSVPLIVPLAKTRDLVSHLPSRLVLSSGMRR